MRMAGVAMMWLVATGMAMKEEPMKKEPMKEMAMKEEPMLRLRGGGKKTTEANADDHSGDSDTKHSTWQAAFRRSYGSFGEGMTNKFRNSAELAKIFHEKLSSHEGSDDASGTGDGEASTMKMKDVDEEASSQHRSDAKQHAKKKTKRKELKGASKPGKRKNRDMEDSTSEDEVDDESLEDDGRSSQSLRGDEEESELESKKKRIAELMQEIENLRKLKEQKIIEKKIGNAQPNKEADAKMARLERGASKRKDSMSCSEGEEEQEDEDDDDDDDDENEDPELESLIQQQTSQTSAAFATLAWQTEDFIGTELPPPPMQDDDFKEQSAVKIVSNLPERERPFRCMYDGSYFATAQEMLDHIEKQRVRVFNRLKPGDDTFFPRSRMQFQIEKAETNQRKTEEHRQRMKELAAVRKASKGKWKPDSQRLREDSAINK
ncbi:hypothetical protein GUITHDRAFT_134962 [Guillardia theta CCMP2712]|uniref:Uncharacterized protein n=1 Tax=Guillardia theta (strain CCMP2712) TaxID=905079 RepID=L1JQZ8_GUITC|nr:hypothetical protein GUITHDRAFT_134962 [Guillardia theta CCMP2712]EKX50857.1 hypothetical protein GUITHDRAFT_134962 [Guillardia theta CCMP2712]|eukprot:XP_005837837.1 hypothetical protein GUITHDRAFT_134962 [Guillardia theta CCMP2712]